MNSTPRKEVGWVIAAIGVAISVAVSLYPEKPNVPAWVAHLAAGAFILGGLIVVFRSTGHSRAAQGLVCALLVVFACIGAWIASGSDGECTGGFAGLSFQPSATHCRVAFGAGALVVMAMLAFAVRDLLRSRSAG
ncbi:MAG: hypothetical protein LC732_06255 [Acidobacteria bacterium]|nr:hypothetical protein [Acidobacteriota bacterium]